MNWGGKKRSLVPEDRFDILAQNTESKASLSIFFPLLSGPTCNTT